MTQTPGFQHPKQTRHSRVFGSPRAGVRLGWVLSLVFVTFLLGASFSGLGHDHLNEPAGDQHHCVACHLQIHALTTSSITATLQLEPVSEARSASPPRSAPAPALTAPPLRGPPRSHS